MLLSIQLLTSPFFRRGIEGVANQQLNLLSPLRLKRLLLVKKGEEKFSAGEYS
jgi:hypothetical protein